MVTALICHGCCRRTRQVDFSWPVSVYLKLKKRAEPKVFLDLCVQKKNSEECLFPMFPALAKFTSGAHFPFLMSSCCSCVMCEWEPAASAWSYSTTSRTRKLCGEGYQWKHRLVCSPLSLWVVSPVFLNFLLRFTSESMIKARLSQGCPVCHSNGEGRRVL